MTLEKWIGSSKWRKRRKRLTLCNSWSRTFRTKIWKCNMLTMTTWALVSWKPKISTCLKCNCKTTTLSCLLNYRSKSMASRPLLLSWLKVSKPFRTSSLIVDLTLKTVLIKNKNNNHKNNPIMTTLGSSRLSTRTKNKTLRNKMVILTKCLKPCRKKLINMWIDFHLL